MTSIVYWALSFSFALLFGHIARRFRVPRLIGYVVGGFIIGPSVIGVLPERFIKAADVFEKITLAFILFLIGTMVRFERLKHLGKRILNPSVLQVLATFTLVYLVSVIFLPGFTWPLMIAIIAMTTAPAATAMIIEEYNASGPLTDSVIASVAFDNFLVIVLFYLFLPLVLGTGFMKNLETVTFSFVASCALGVAFGLVFSYFEMKIEAQEILFSVSLSLLLLSFGVAIKANLFLYLVALLFGISAGNSSLRNLKAVKSLKLLDFPVYALFFTIAGASLHVSVLVKVKYAVIVYILFRFIGKWLGASIGMRWARLDDYLKKYLGFGIVSHAGLATGLALTLGSSGDRNAVYIMNIVLASTVFFELVGPLLLKEVLVRAGEVKVISILKGGGTPIFDIEFQTVLRNFIKSIGLGDPFKPKHLSEAKVVHVMRRHFIPVDSKAHLNEMIRYFEKAHCTALPVVNEDGIYRGILLLHDIETLMIDDVTSRLIVADDALKEVPGLSKDDNLKGVLDKFRELGVDSLPVVENDRVIGVVMRKDVVAALS